MFSSASDHSANHHPKITRRSALWKTAKGWQEARSHPYACKNGRVQEESKDQQQEHPDEQFW